MARERLVAVLAVAVGACAIIPVASGSGAAARAHSVPAKMTLIADKQCGPREALFSGVWKSTPL